MDVEVDPDREILVNNRPATLESLIYENFSIDWTVLAFGAAPVQAKETGSQASNILDQLKHASKYGFGSEAQADGGTQAEAPDEAKQAGAGASGGAPRPADPRCRLHGVFRRTWQGDAG